MPDDSYDRDVLAWSEHQAALLRRLAAGERLNERVDWANVIEEVENVGRSDLIACESLLEQALVHLLKLHAWPTSQSAPRWRPETRAFFSQARRRFSPSMRQRIALADIYADALRQYGDTTDDAGARRSVPDRCPCGLDELLEGDLPELLRRLDTKLAS